jgi:hypothetical protein
MKQRKGKGRRKGRKRRKRGGDVVTWRKKMW